MSHLFDFQRNGLIGNKLILDRSLESRAQMKRTSECGEGYINISIVRPTDRPEYSTLFPSLLAKPHLDNMQ